MKLTTLANLDKNAFRLRDILATLGRYGLADWLSGTRYDWLDEKLLTSDGEKLSKFSTEERIRLAITELGTTFIKLGQLLSTRIDLIGPKLAGELGKLQSSRPPEDFDIVRKTIESELGKSVEELFLVFEQEPIGSASIGQVHAATLKDGTEVVVKVQRSGVEEIVSRDLDLMDGLAELLEQHVKALAVYRPKATIRDFRRQLTRELDYTIERRNLEAFQRHFSDRKEVHFPFVYPDFSSRRLLTMERLRGQKLTSTSDLVAKGADLDALARNAARMYLDMIFRDGFYHADPHPGNFLVLEGSVIGVLDAGMVGRIDNQLREDFEDLLMAIISRDSVLTTDIVILLTTPHAEFDRDQLRADIDDFLAMYVSASLADFDLGGCLERMSEILRHYHLSLPPAASLLLKTLVMLEGTSRAISPTFSLAEILDDYKGTAVKRRLGMDRWLSKIRRSVRDWDQVLTMLPVELAEAMRRMRSGSFEIKHEHRRLEEAMDRVVLALISAALILATPSLITREAASFWGYLINLLGYATLFGGVYLALYLFNDIRKAHAKK